MVPQPVHEHKCMRVSNLRMRRDDEAFVFVEAAGAAEQAIVVVGVVLSAGGGVRCHGSVVLFVLWIEFFVVEFGFNYLLLILLEKLFLELADVGIRIIGKVIQYLTRVPFGLHQLFPPPLRFFPLLFVDICLIWVPKVFVVHLIITIANCVI